MKNSSSKIIISVAVCVIVAIICATVIGVTFIKGDNEQTTVQTTTEEAAALKENDEVKITTTESTAKATTEATTVDAGKLYRPSSSKYCNQYERYISGAHEGQGYAKMRFGPSKYKYDVVGQIDNGGVVTVQTQSVDGWTLIYYQGTEGWVRTDFLFENYDDCFVVTTTKSVKKGDVAPDIRAGGCLYFVDVTGQYDGEPLNMRSGPHKDYELITTVPDGASVTMQGYGRNIDDWCYVEYNGHYGWVLSKYLFEADGVGDKPVLYLYPEKQTDVKVKVNLNNAKFSCTYPEYNGGWNVTAQPDGTLLNKADGREFSYLYWELKGKADFDFSEGFVVKGSETAEFLQNTLAQMGLTPREYNEFIVYWLPLMQDNEYNLISFQREKYEDICSLDINPAPDSVLRVFMAYKALDEYVDIEPQSFEKFERNGFTVVEWGGAEVK